MASYPLYLPPEARRLFQAESLLRRFANNARLSASTRLLEFYGSLGGLALTKALGCTLTVVEPDRRVVDSLVERARLAGLADRVSYLHQPVTEVSFDEASFDGILSLGRVIGSVDEVARAWRPWLAPKGRVALTTIVRVGRQASPTALAAWEQRLGAPLAMPREVLLTAEAAGFEPELVESLGDGELDEYYRELELVLPKATDAAGAEALRKEIALHRSEQGKSGVTYAALILRRKEPGEKPPISRDGG